MKDIAHEILKSATYHFRNALILDLEKDESKRNVAVSNMQQAEDMMIEALEKFKAGILHNAGN
jgi:hypothetical protein